MKKLSAIICICILAYSQYARQYSYLECVIANNFKNEAVKCACETTRDEAQNAMPTQPHSHNKHTHHINFDEWYTSLPSAGAGIEAVINLGSYPVHHDPAYLHGHQHAIEHPPRPVFTIG